MADYTDKKRVPQKAKRDHLHWLHTLRFIEEVERLERDGRVKNRSDLEERLLLPYNRLTDMRAGRIQVPTSAIELLKREFNGDFQFVLLGIRDAEHSGPVRAGRDLRQHKGYDYRYLSPPADLRALAGLPPLPKPEVAPS
jgi:hypothetical protein